VEWSAEYVDLMSHSRLPTGRDVCNSADRYNYTTTDTDNAHLTTHVTDKLNDTPLSCN